MNNNTIVEPLYDSSPSNTMLTIILSLEALLKYILSGDCCYIDVLNLISISSRAS